MGVRSDGVVFEWSSGGGNPVQRGDISGVRRLSVGYEHVLALRVDGLVWSWLFGGRSNGSGHLGNGTMANSYIATPIAGLTNVAEIAAGYAHSLAAKIDGSVWAWGNNSQGQLGDGSLTNRYAPVAVTGLTGVIRVAGGNLHSLALKGDKTVVAWGYNIEGQLVTAPPRSAMRRWR